MNKGIYYDAIMDFLVGGLKSEDELTTVLNFLDHAKSVVRHLYWEHRVKKDLEEDRKYLGLDPVE